MALGLAVNARGADHNRSGAYEADLSGELDRLDGGERTSRAAIETEDRAAVMDSLILCKFLRGVFTEPFDEWAALLRRSPAGTSTATSCARPRAGSCRQAAFNRREGWTREEDTLPPRLLAEPLKLPSGREAALTPRAPDAMIDAYYGRAGWTHGSTTREACGAAWR